MVTYYVTMNGYQKTLTILLVVFALFVTILFFLALSFIFILHGDTPSGFIGLFIDYHIHLMIVLGLLGIALGVISYKGFSQQHKEAVDSRNFSRGILLRFLDSSERTIVTHILDSEQDSITQATISRLPNMGKVKSYRTLQRLEAKKIVTLVPHGKTKRIVLDEEILVALQE